MNIFSRFINPLTHRQKCLSLVLLGSLVGCGFFFLYILRAHSYLGEIDLAIIPGRAFTHDGQRMGRGKGFYDRTLTSIRCPKWGVAFACQIVDEIPTDPWDIRLDRIINN